MKQERIDGLRVPPSTVEKIEEEAKRRGLAYRSFLRQLVLEGARAEGLEV